MTLSDLLSVLPDSEVLSVGFIKSLVAETERGRVTWVGTARAGEILGEQERRVRRMAVRWERSQSRGARPEVRVRRKSGAPNSHFELCEEDCWALRRAAGAVAVVPQEDSGGFEGDEDAELARDIVRRQFG